MNPHYPIAAVERETGIPKDLLRQWERRYQFPLPARDDKGDRLYSQQELDKLRLIRLLMDREFRRETFARCPAAVRERCTLGDLDRVGGER